jgi:hypothetical protein
MDPQTLVSDPMQGDMRTVLKHASAGLIPSIDAK